jgi:DNA polymerase (family 10)
MYTPISNLELAEKLDYIGKLYQVAKDKWRASTYIKAAGIIRDLCEHAGSVNLIEIEGIGKSTVETIHEILAKGTCKRIKELEKKFPPGAFTLQAIPGVGPVGAFNLARQYNVTSVEGLIAVLEKSGSDLGLLEKARIGLEQMKQGRLPRKIVRPLVEVIIEKLRTIPTVYQCEAAGSYRRHSDTVKDVDILLSLKEGEKSNALAEIKSVISQFGQIQSAGEKKIALRHQGNFIINIDLLIVENRSWGAALCYFTGSKAHNIRLRGIAKSRGMLVNEYGFFKGPDAKQGIMNESERIGGQFEVELYNLLNLKYINPNDRNE